MSKNVVDNFDREAIEVIFNKYPKLETIICAGTVSLKATRDILGIDRYMCWELYLQLLEAGAVYGSGSNMYRASDAMKEFMVERRSKGGLT